MASSSFQPDQEIYLPGSFAEGACSWSIAYPATNKCFFYLGDLNYDPRLPNFRGSPAVIQVAADRQSKLLKHSLSAILDCCLRLLKEHNLYLYFQQYSLSVSTCRTCKDFVRPAKCWLPPSFE